MILLVKISPSFATSTVRVERVERQQRVERQERVGNFAMERNMSGLFGQPC